MWPGGPLDATGRGVDFAASLEHVFSGLSGAETVMLEHRLVEGMTLGECAERRGVTRERVRQLEVKLLREIERRLEFSGALRDRLLEAWVARRDDWFTFVNWQGPPGGAPFERAALEAVIRGSA